MDPSRNRPHSRQRGDSLLTALLTLAFLLFTLHPARAWPQTVPWELAEAASLAAGIESLPSPPERSESTALLLSTVSLVVPVITGVLLASHAAGSDQGPIGMSVIGGGLLFGPSAGYFYGGCPRRALVGIGIRAGISALTLATFALTPPSDGPDVDILIGGASLVLVTIQGLYECLAVGSCVGSHNSRPIDVWVAPGAAPRSMNVGLRVTY